MATTSSVNSSQTSFDYSTLNAKSATSSANAVTEAQDRFLKLLTTQLKNQDPLNPLDNAQMTSQLAQISTVDGITKLNATLQTLLNNASDSQTLQAAAMVGRSVLAEGNGLRLQQGQAVGGVDMAAAADEVVATIKDANGLVVRTLNLGALDAGMTNFAWDGTADSGTAAADGNYSVSFTAKQGANKVVATALEFGMVTSVAKTAQGISLTAGNLGTLTLSDIKQIL